MLTGDRADLVPDDDPGDDLLAHSVGGPVVLPAPAEEAMIGLRPDALLLELLSETVCRREDEQVLAAGTAKELNASCGLATATSAIEVGQLAGRKWVFMARGCGVLPDVATAPVSRLGHVRCVLVPGEDPFPFVAPLGRLSRRDWCCCRSDCWSRYKPF